MVSMVTPKLFSSTVVLANSDHSPGALLMTAKETCGLIACFWDRHQINGDRRLPQGKRS